MTRATGTATGRGSGNSNSFTQFQGGSPPPPVMLQTLPFLAGLPPQEIVALLQANSQVVPFPAGRRLAQQGDVAEFVFFLIDGSVRLIRQGKAPSRSATGNQPTSAGPGGQTVEVINRVVGPGHLIGRYELIYNLKYTATATAENDVTALCIKRSTLERLLYRYPAVRQRVANQAVINRLRTMPLLADVNLVILGYLAEELQAETVAAGDVIYTQDQPADSLFLINQGQVELYHPRRTDDRLWLGTGCPFGFAGSVGAGPGAPTDRYGHWAEAKTETTLYKLPRKRMEQIGRRYPQVVDPEVQRLPCQTISAVSVFDNLSELDKIRLAGFCSFQHIPQHHLIMQQGDIGDSMWILLEGSQAVLSALDNSNRALPRTPVSGTVYFGETALRAASNVESTVEAEPGSLWLRLHWQDFQRFSQLFGTDVADKINVHLPAGVSAAIGEFRQDYSWLGRGEVLITLRRRHWLALLQKMNLTGLALLISIGFTLALSYFSVSLWISLGISGFFVGLALLWGIIDYLNDYFIVTNQRVIQQEKVILTSEQRREALLEQIQRVDVSSSFWGNLLDYGVVSVFTAGTTGSIDFDYVPDPAELRATIFRQRSLRYQRYSAESKLEIQNALEERLGLIVDLPSRVRAYTAPRASNETPGLSLWQTFLQHITVDSQLQWESTDRIVWHKHWWVLLRQVGFFGMLFLLELIIMVGGLAFIDLFQQFESFVDATILSLELVMGLLMLVTLGYIIWIVIDWWNDTYTVTRDRIIDVEKLPLFLSEQRREAQLSDIQDIRLEINSPLEMILDFGDIIVQTAASEGAFTFDHIPNPRAVKEEINRRLVEWRREDERRKAREQIRDLPDWFEMYNRLEPGQTPSRPVSNEDA